MNQQIPIPARTYKRNYTPKQKPISLSQVSSIVSKELTNAFRLYDQRKAEEANKKAAIARERATKAELASLRKQYKNVPPKITTFLKEHKGLKVAEIQNETGKALIIREPTFRGQSIINAGKSSVLTRNGTWGKVFSAIESGTEGHDGKTAVKIVVEIPADEIKQLRTFLPKKKESSA